MEHTQRGPVYADPIGSFLFVTLNQPAIRNPLGPEIVEEIQRMLDTAQEDASIRAVVFRGAGETFSAGGNLAKFEARRDSVPPPGGPDPIAASNRRFGDFLLRLTLFPKPVVALVQGAAVGGGMGLVCAADIAVCAADAKFALTETSIGLLPAQVLPFVMDRVGPHNARRLMLTAERVTAREALRIGLVDIVEEGPAALTARLAAVLDGIGKCSPRANAVTKGLSRRWQQALHDTESLGKLLDDAASAFAQQMRSADFEGVRAARERRAPPWRTVLDAAQRELLVLEAAR